MAKKMLIDATHAEETRVVVVDGNKVEEFDFESENKRQIAGNIYLAKVTRVEPSLQAAFVDYGGNRHGFLAFSEIHPDYYQIPVADREALMAEERAYARAQEEEDEKPAKRTRTRRTRSRGKQRSDEQADSKSEVTAAGADVAPADAVAAAPAQKSIGGMDVVELDGADEDAHGVVDAVSPDIAAQDTTGAAAVETPAETAAPAAEDVKADVATPEAEVSTAAAPEGEAVKSEDVTSAENTAENVSDDSVSDDIASDDTEADKDKSGDTTPDVIAQDSNNDDPVISKDAVPADQVAADAAAPEAGADEKTARTPDTAAIETVSEGPGTAAEEAAAEVAGAPETPVADVVAEDAPATAVVETAADSAAPVAAAEAATDNSDDDSDDGDDDSDDDDDENKPADAFEKDDSIESIAEEDVQEEIRQPRKPRPRRYKIQEVIKVRQILLVQVVKEERGNKGAALTTYLSLAGRYCVLMPNTARGGGISRKITNIADRKKLKEIAAEIDVPEGAGLIIRTAGAARTRSEIKRDYEYLQRMWEQIRTLTLKSTAPAKIYEEGDLIKRSIRDLYNSDIDEVFVEGDAGYRIAKDFMKMIMPSHAKNVKRYNEGLPLFARYQVEAYLGGMFNPTVQLRSGGYIVIDVTEALVAVDVNSGRATKEGSIEETALKTNLEAAEEVARQARLRDLAGLIVIDFIDMEERRNNTAVEKRLKDKLKTDRARIQIGRISGFGLLEMSRQRLRPGMLEATTQPCHHCHGTGLIRSDDNLALNILRQLEEEGTRRRSREVLLTAPLPIINYLINNKRENIASIEARYGMSIRIEADPSMVSPNFTIEKFKIATRVVKEVTSAVVSVDSKLMDAIDEEDARAAEVAEAADFAAEAARDTRPTQERQNQERQDSPAAADAETDDADRPKKRRRRRRRRKSGNGEGAEAASAENQAQDQATAQATDQDAAPEQPAEAVQGAEASAVSTEADAAPEEVKKPARRRSRKPRASAAADAETSAETPADAIAEAPAEAAADGEASPAADKPKKRVTRSRARAKVKPAADAVEGEAAPAATGEVVAEAEKPAPKKRAPRKRKPKVAEQVAEPVAEAVAESAAESVAEPVADVAVEAVSDAVAAPAPAAAVAEMVAETIAAAPATPVAAESAAAVEVVQAEPEAAPVVAKEEAKEEVKEEVKEDAKPKRKGWWSLGR
jgi:ribonuclease E